MAPRRGTVGELQLAFDALTIKGGLLGADWLAKIALLQTGIAQSAADYRVPKGLDLRDEIARSWRIAQAYFQELQTGRDAGGNPSELAERFVEGLLRYAFGFDSIARAGPTISGERIFPVQFYALGDRVPIVVAPLGTGLDTRLPELGDGWHRRTAFDLLQEVLNTLNTSLWGLACDGVQLRLGRDNASLTRKAWIEADLGRIFTEALFPDFAALWLLIHESRFGRPEDPTTQCPLESWREAGREEGTLARGKLSNGFRQALELLGQGFLAHPANASLRAALHEGTLTKDQYFGQLLRLVYRLIFLLATEERGLLHPKDSSTAAQALYAGGYALRRLRDRAIRRSAHDRQSDQWEAVKIVFRGLTIGEPRLALPALAGLFAPAQCPQLDVAKLENQAFLAALFHLAWLRDSSGLVRVNWRDMGPDELGYIYEGLLELGPQITEDGRSFSFAGEDESRGHTRKITGSYYTPDELVQLLLESALDPVIARTIDAHPADPVEALLQLAIVDPTCGSGHFLLAAAHRLADKITHLRAGGSSTPDEYQHALREVVRNCIYGVDMNPLAVELCKVSLWMESIDPGQPLTFLESHVRCGNALLGTTRALMSDGVPDIAWSPLEGDDKAISTALRRRNRDEAGGQKLLLFGERPDGAAWRDIMRQLERAPDVDLITLTEKERQWQALLESQAYDHEKLVADAWCAAFLWPKDKSGSVVDAAPTAAVWQSLRDKNTPPLPDLIETTRHISDEYALFHWELAFPHVFARGGFDVVIGNPPWEHVELKEQEFFAKRDSSIAGARNASARKERIAALPVTNPMLWAEWQTAKRRSQGETHFARSSGRFPLTARGRINTYPLFAEHNWRCLNARGRAGFIVPSGIATDDNTKDYFQAIVSKHSLHSLWEFENEGFFTAGKGHMLRFALMTLGGPEDTASAADFLFQGQAVSDISDPERHFTLSTTDIEVLNPNTGTCPIFRRKRDRNITLAMYDRSGILWREGHPDGNPWGLKLMQGVFNMASDSGLFRTHGELASAGWTLHGNHFEHDSKVMLPVYEAKMTYQYNHRSGTYEGAAPGERPHRLPSPSEQQLVDPSYAVMPYYWAAQEEIDTRLDGAWTPAWFLGWRRVTDARASVRTLVPAIIPRSGPGDSLFLALPAAGAPFCACLYANLCSLPLDYAARQKIGGLNFMFYIFKQLPALPPESYLRGAPWDSGHLIRDWILRRVLELTYTAWDLKPFAEDCGEDGPPYLWDSNRRFQLQCEIDAAFFHLYSVSRDEVSYILDSFDVLARSEVHEYREYKTKRVVLEVYDALAAAAAGGTPYVSSLGPARRAS